MLLQQQLELYSRIYLLMVLFLACTWDRLTLHAKYPSCHSNPIPGWLFIHREEFAFNTCTAFAMPRVGPISMRGVCVVLDATDHDCVHAFFFCDARHVPLELGIVSSLRDSLTNLMLPVPGYRLFRPFRDSRVAKKIGCNHIRFQSQLSNIRQTKCVD
jgi:hypothetical protein